MSQHLVTGQDLGLEDRAVAAAGLSGDPVPEALAQWFMASMEYELGRAEDALDRLRASTARLVASGAGMALPQSRMLIADIRAGQGDLEEATRVMEEVVGGGADHGYNLSMILIHLGEILRLLGRPNQAEARVREGLVFAQRIQSRHLRSIANQVLGNLACDRADWSEAADLLTVALSEQSDADLRSYIPRSLDSLARVEAALGSEVDAVRLLGAADGLRSSLGYVRWPALNAQFETLTSRLRSDLGTDGFEQAWTDGAGMDMESAVAFALRLRAPRKRPALGWDALTPAELKVAALVAEGLTNPQVADRLFISRATVKVHLAHIFQKLDVRTRAQLSGLFARR